MVRTSPLFEIKRGTCSSELFTNVRYKNFGSILGLKNTSSLLHKINNFKVISQKKVFFQSKFYKVYFELIKLFLFYKIENNY